MAGGMRTRHGWDGRPPLSGIGLGRHPAAARTEAATAAAPAEATAAAAAEGGVVGETVPQRPVTGAPEPERDRPTHCWVRGLPELREPCPGLLAEWRRDPHGWSGRVVYAVLEAGRAVLVEAWVPAEHLSRDRRG